MTVSRFYMTQSIRRAYRKANLFLQKINYAAKDDGVFFKLGKNLIWIELHLVPKPGDRKSTGTEVIMSKQPVSNEEIKSFAPKVLSYAEPKQEVQLDENKVMSLLRQESRKLGDAGKNNGSSKGDGASGIPEEGIIDVKKLDEEMKMLM